MKIRIEDIPDEGLTIFLRGQDGWFGQTIIEAFPRENPETEKAEGSLVLSRVDRQVNVSGFVDLFLRPVCSRCLEMFSFRLKVPVVLYLSPEIANGEDLSDEDASLSIPDEEFGVYANDEIDLSEIIREQMVLSLPLRFICSEECKGLCSTCGINLDRASCNCKEKKPTDPWKNSAPWGRR